MSADETAELLGSAEYEAVFTKAMSGVELAVLSPEELELVRRARALTDTPPPGLPAPTSIDPSRK